MEYIELKNTLKFNLSRIFPRTIDRTNAAVETKSLFERQKCQEQNDTDILCRHFRSCKQAFTLTSNNYNLCPTTN